MSIDLESQKGRKKYLSEKLDDLLDGINESYGAILVDELLNRLELTIMDFNNEMKDLCSDLVKKQQERIQYLELIKSKNNLVDVNSKLDNSSANQLDVDKSSSLIDGYVENDTPAWEKKLAKLEKNKK